MGYHRAGFEVVGVDINPQPHYPFEFHRHDALLYWLVSGSNFDAVHASPPCQAHSTLRSLHPDRDYPDLIAATREVLSLGWQPYVIENVVGAPLRNPIMMCGSSFGLGVRRHRLFECSWPGAYAPLCQHELQPEPIDVSGTGARRLAERTDGKGGNSRKPKNLEQARWAMGIDWMTRRELSQAIPPAYTEYIGRQLMRVLERSL